LNLWGLGMVDDLKNGAHLASEVINSGNGIKIVEDLVFYSNGNTQKFNKLINT